MKKIVLTTFFVWICLFLLFSEKSMAFSPLPHALPYTYNNMTFTKVAQFIDHDGDEWTEYMQDGTNYLTFGQAYVSGGHRLWVGTSELMFKNGQWFDSNNLTLEDIYLDSSSCPISSIINSQVDIKKPEYYNGNYSDYCGYKYLPINTVVISSGDWIDPGVYSQLTVNLNPAEGGSVTSSPGSLTCLGNTCTGSFSGNISVITSVNSGYQFLDWYENGSVITNNCPATTLNLTMSAARTITAKFIPEATDFVFPVLKAGVTDPLQNKANPIGNGWHGIGLGEQGINDAYGHLGQDYVMDSNNGDGDAAGEPVYAVANGIIVEVVNNQSTSYGWCDNGDHGWGPVVVIKHVKASGFDTTNSILTSTCGTETNPTVIYSLYGHLSKTSIQELAVGQIIEQGQQIGILGAEGTDWGESMVNHLHFELKDEAGYGEGTWYISNNGQCPGSISYVPCIGTTVKGVGTAYSHTSGFAPHRYTPGIFIPSNQQ